MKITALIICFFSLNTFCQNRTTKYTLDANGKNVRLTKRIYENEKYPDNSWGFRIEKDSGMIHQHNVPKYSTYKLDYNYFKGIIEKHSNNKYSDSTIFLIKYYYLNDNCSDSFSNEMTNELINDNKILTDFHKVNIENESNIIFLVFFENGIKLNNKVNSKNEYYFTDEKNIFRNNIFVNPTLCGSFGLIKPNGETLIRNGEYRADWIVNHLDTKIWNTIFQQ